MIRLTFLLAVVVSIISCNSNEAEVNRLKTENDSLLADKHRTDSTLRTISRTYEMIDSNNLIIERKKASIAEIAKKKRLNEDDKATIMAEMDTINMMMALNNGLVQSLDSSLEDQPGTSIPLDQLLSGMEHTNENTSDELHDMKTELASISSDFSNLFEDYVYKEAENLEMQEQLSSQQRELEAAQERLDQAKEKLNAAWYVVGTKVELKEKGLVLKKGFFDDKDMSEDFDKSQFKKINIHELKQIILDSKKADIITTHPSESYEMVGMKKKVNRLVIKNPELFWSVSKFLIIEVEES